MRSKPDLNAPRTPGQPPHKGGLHRVDIVRPPTEGAAVPHRVVHSTATGSRIAGHRVTGAKR